jgi:transposase InsO family protein
VEAIPTKFSTDVIVIKFPEENILTRFECPRKIVTDNAQAFKSLAMIEFCQKYNIILGHSTPYYPQGNGLAKSSNKILMRFIKKVLTNNKIAWHSHLKFALWANRSSTKISTGISPFQLIYGINVVLIINLYFLVMKLLQDSEEEPNDIIRRMN